MSETERVIVRHPDDVTQAGNRWSRERPGQLEAIIAYGPVGTDEDQAWEIGPRWRDSSDTPATQVDK